MFQKFFKDLFIKSNNNLEKEKNIDYFLKYEWPWLN
jgi:hypothetical protein